MSNAMICWLSIGSTYTYLTSQRIRDILQNQTQNFVIKPFSVRKIMMEMENIPFPLSKIKKVNYMWRDIERRSKKYCIPIPKAPVPYPLKNFDLANLVGILAVKEGWYLDYFETTYALWFTKNLEAGSQENLKQTCLRINQDFNEVIKKVNSPNILSEYNNNTDEARKSNIFGAPSFQVLDEVFWGDDRLEDAVEYYNSIL